VNVLLVTLTVSVCLTAIFVLAFMFSHLRRRDAGPEHESLLPLDDGDPAVVPAARPVRPASSDQ
jgi:hypothetical protein